MAIFIYQTLRFVALLKKEFIIIRRDFITYLFLIILPFIQVILFGYIINSDAKHLPTIVITEDTSQLTNSIIQGFRNTQYFDIKSVSDNYKQAENLMNKDKILFIINIPANFTRDFILKKLPHILLEGNASDPLAVQNAFNVGKMISENVLTHDLHGSLNYLSTPQSKFIIDTQAKYNPSIIARYHTLPGLIVTILTLTLVMLTAISITSEFENGTMETLLITPLKPLEVIIGKIIPGTLVGYILFFLILVITRFLFDVPFYGSLALLVIVSFPFLLCNLGIGIFVSTLAKSQFRAVNLANTYNLPAILLCGFMFPFYAMPEWAQWIGNLLPTTHFLRIVSNIMLKGADFLDVWPDVWPIILFLLLIIFISFKYYRTTLD